MNLKKISEVIMGRVNHNKAVGKEDVFIVEDIESILKRRVVDILEPEGVYEKGKHYAGLGKYLGIVDTHPHGSDYFIKRHHFSEALPIGTDASKINKILIQEIKK